MAARLQSEANRAVAQKFIRSGLRQGLSANSIYTQLQAAKLGYRRQDFLADVRSINSRPLGRPVPFDALEGLTRVSKTSAAFLVKGTTKYQYAFTSRTRNERGQFNGGIVSWSFTSSVELIPSIAFSIGQAIVPDVSVERYAKNLPEDTAPIYNSDIEMYDEPLLIGGS